MKIGDTVQLTQEYKTPGGKTLKAGVKGTVLAVDRENCMVRFSHLTSWLIVPKDILEII